MECFVVKERQCVETSESRSEIDGRMRIGFVRQSWISTKEAKWWVAIVGLMTWRISQRNLACNC